MLCFHTLLIFILYIVLDESTFYEMPGIILYVGHNETKTNTLKDSSLFAVCPSGSSGPDKQFTIEKILTRILLYLFALVKLLGMISENNNFCYFISWLILL